MQTSFIKMYVSNQVMYVIMDANLKTRYECIWFCVSISPIIVVASTKLLTPQVYIVIESLEFLFTIQYRVSIVHSFIEKWYTFGKLLIFATEKM